MTPQQAKTLEFLRTYSAARNGTMPSYQEIADHIGIRSKGAVSSHIAVLVERGFIRRTKNRSRSIELIVDRDAVLVERERCAKIAEAHAERCARGSAVSSMAEDAWGSAAGREIATAIRRST